MVYDEYAIIVRWIINKRQQKLLLFTSCFCMVDQIKSCDANIAETPPQNYIHRHICPQFATICEIFRLQTFAMFGVKMPKREKIHQRSNAILATVEHST